MSMDTRMSERSDLAGSGNEMNFALFLRILSRRRAWIVALTVLITMAGASYAFLTPPVYEASARLVVGQAVGGGFFEAPAVLTSRLEATYGRTIADGIKRKRPFLHAAVSRAIPGAVDITVEGDRPEDAVLFLKNVTAEIQRKHNEAYRSNIDAVRARIDAIPRQEASLEKQFDQISDLIERLKRSDPVQASLLVLERGRIPRTIKDLEAERPELIQKLTPPMTEQTALLGEIVAPAIPAQPGKFTILMLSIITGIVVGVMSALAVESLIAVQQGGVGSVK